MVWIVVIIDKKKAGPEGSSQRRGPMVLSGCRFSSTEAEALLPVGRAPQLAERCPKQTPIGGGEN